MAHDLKKKWRSDDVKLKENADFSSLLLSERVLSGLTKAGFRRPSPIQFEAIPIGRYGIDLLVQAKSGTGKTLVFTVLALEKLQHKLFRPQVLIIAPTREIATQICSVVKTVGSAFPKLTCCSFIGGLSVEDDKIKAYTCQVVVGTPGRLKQLIQLGCLPTSSIRLFVLDEADELLQSSFKAAVEDIFNVLPKDKQVIATSATYPPEMKKLLYNYLVEPHVVSLSAKKLALLGIVHYAKVVPYSLMPIMSYRYKLEALEKILRKLRYSQCLIFCNGLAKVELLCRDIKKWGFSTTFMSSAKDQIDRLKVIDRLKEFKCKILVSSDVAARGIDAENVDLVINFELPQATETYLHRAGRAGRYGSHGVSINLVNDKELKNMEDKETEGGFKTYKLPDPPPSDLIRNPVLGEYLFDDIKLDSTASDNNICEKEANLSNGQEEAGEALPDVAAFKENKKLRDQSNKKQYSSSDTEIENGTAKQNLKCGIASSLECVSNVSPEENTSPIKTAVKHKVANSKTKTENGTPEKCSRESVADVSEHLLEVPLLEPSKNIVGSVELQCSKVDSKTESVTSEVHHQNVNVIDVPESMTEVVLKETRPFKKNPIEHKLISNNAEINNEPFKICDHIQINSSNVHEHVSEAVKQNIECEEKFIPLPPDTESVIEIETSGTENTKTSEVMISNCINLASLEENNLQISVDSESDDSYMNLKKTDELMNFAVLSPKSILKAKSENLPDQEIPLNHDYENSDINDEVIIKMIDSLEEKSDDDVLALVEPVGKFASYEEYDLCFKMKSFLREYEENKKNGVSAFEREDDSNSVKSVTNNNSILAEKMKAMMSGKSEYYYQVFKTYLPESMVSNNNKADKKSNSLFIKNDETEKQNVCLKSKIEHKTVSKEFERTCPQLLDETSENSHVVDSSNQVKNDDVTVKLNVPKLASTSGIGKVLFYRPNYIDSGSDVPAIKSWDDFDSNTTSDSTSGSCGSGSSSLSCNEGIDLKKRLKGKESDSNSDSECCIDSHSDSSSHAGNFQSKERDFDNKHNSGSSSDSEYNSENSDSDLSSYKRNRPSKKRRFGNSQESDSSSDSEFSSDSSDSDSSSCKRNIPSKKRDFGKGFAHEADSYSSSESSSLSSDTDSSCSHERKAHLKRNKVGNLQNPFNMFNTQQNGTSCTSFASSSKNSTCDHSKFFPSFVETPYQQYNYSHCNNTCMSGQSSTQNSLNTEKIESGKFQDCNHCAKYQPTHCCMKAHKQPHGSLNKRCISGKCHKFADNSAKQSTDYCSGMHSHSGNCYIPSSHRCHPMLPNFSCSNQICAQWYNIFYTQWMCIRRHANLPF